MYYIIETEEQLTKFKTYNLEDCFVEFITQDDRMHPALAKVSLVYLKPSKSRTGFILPVEHSEAFSLPLDTIIALINDKIKNMSVYDAKKAKCFLGDDRVVKDLKMLRFLDEGEIVEHETFNTVAHNFLYGKYPRRDDINMLIPISKHQEKWNNLVKAMKVKPGGSKRYHSFYCNMANDVLRKVEANGIGLDYDVLLQHYTPKRDVMSIDSNKIYTSYNLYTATGRPSDTFNGINFAAMNKGDASREFIIPLNDVLIEMDYSSYHPRILANLIEYSFDEVDIHTHLGRIYFNTDELTHEQYDESKKLTFKYLYTTQGEGKGIPFFDRAKELKDYLWGVYITKGYITSPISKRPIFNIENKTQILPYILQMYETERNIMIMNDIHEYLKGKDTKFIMYSYDAFLFDFKKSDGEQTLTDLQHILEVDDFPVSISYGKNYGDLKRLPL